jgi:hypothetical protein
MKALTVQQPWAWAVQNKHLKHFEEPFAPKVRGYFLIHAGLGWDWELEHHLQEDRGIMVPSPLPQGSIVGYARLINVTSRPMNTPRVKSRSFMCHNLAEIVKIEPTVAAGRRGYWLVPERMMKLITVPDTIITLAL